MNLTAIAIVSVVAWAIVSIVKMSVNKSRQGENNKSNDALTSEINQLKERIAVLEKIVTDERHDLRKEIDDL